MRLTRTAALTVLGATAGLLIPVTSLQTASAQPVEPVVHRLALNGVAAGAMAEAPAAPGHEALRTPEIESFDQHPEALTDELDTEPFTLVGVTWSRTTPAPGTVVQVRVRENSSWSEWQTLEVMDEGPDPGTAESKDLDRRVGTSPLLTSGADGAQVRVDTPDGTLPQDLRLELVDPGRSKADASLMGATPAASAGAVAARPTIITRAQWGADESLRSGAPSYSSSVKVGIVHHTASTNNYSPDQAAGQVRSIYAYHTRSNGWSDIGYNFLVDRFGRIYEGRAGGMDRAVVGAHAGGFNSQTFGVSAIGNFDEQAPPPAVAEAIAQVLAWKYSVHAIDPRGVSTLVSAGGGTSRYPAGQAVQVGNLIGHRVVGQTACPGRYLNDQLASIRQRAVDLIGGLLIEPWTQVDPRTPTSNGAVYLRAGMMAPGSWTVDVTNDTGSLVRRITGSGGYLAAAWDLRGSDGRPVPDGSYVLTTTSVQNGRPSQTWRTTLRTAEARGNLEAVTPVPGSARIVGWALSTATGAPVTVEVTVDGRPVASATASLPRPDVAAAYPGHGDRHGFDLSVPATSGSHTVCVTVVLSGGLGSPSLGCRTVSVPAGSSSDPSGVLESVNPVLGGSRIVGWAADKDAIGPVDVHVYVDGVGAGSYPAGVQRSDLGRPIGFDVLLALTPGSTREVCAFAINVGAGTRNANLGCRPVTIPSGNPVGNVEVVRGVPGAVRVAGWALDPDTTGAVGIHVYIDGAYAGAVTAAGNRPDVAALHPVMGPAHGFDATVKVGGGTRVVCVFAINSGPGTANPLLGCGRTVVPSGNPIGTWDGVSGGRGSVSMSGWVYDPDTTAPVPLHVYVDGVYRGAYPADVERPDVGAAFPDYGPRHGYAITVTGLPAGRHQVCVFGINLGPGDQNPLLGCPSAVSS